MSSRLPDAPAASSQVDAECVCAFWRPLACGMCGSRCQDSSLSASRVRQARHGGACSLPRGRPLGHTQTPAAHSRANVIRHARRLLRLLAQDTLGAGQRQVSGSAADGRRCSDLHRRGCLHLHHVALLRDAARLHVAHGWLSRPRAAQQPGSLPRPQDVQRTHTQAVVRRHAGPGRGHSDPRVPSLRIPGVRPPVLHSVC